MKSREQVIMETMTRVNKQIIVSMGALAVASLSACRAISRLKEVLPTERDIHEAAWKERTTKEKLEEMVEEYSQSVN